MIYYIACPGLKKSILGTSIDGGNTGSLRVGISMS
jgi:hypothetical protein